MLGCVALPILLHAFLIGLISRRAEDMKAIVSTWVPNDGVSGAHLGTGEAGCGAVGQGNRKFCNQSPQVRSSRLTHYGVGDGLDELSSTAGDGVGEVDSGAGNTAPLDISHLRCFWLCNCSIAPWL